MKIRVLPVLNAVGCLVLTGLVLVQWQNERALDDRLSKLQTQLAASRQDLADEKQRAADLQRDIDVLKEAIETTQLSAEATAKALAEREIETDTLQQQAEEARGQVAQWEAAIEERDTKLRDLNTQLAATRKRLDEAVAKLKAAGAR